jgi:hypothetical protein
MRVTITTPAELGFLVRPVGVLSEEVDSRAFADEPAWASDPEGFDL